MPRSTGKFSKKQALPTLAASALALGAMATPAFAAPEGKLAEPMQFSLGAGIGARLSVISTNGVDYDSFKPGSSINLGGPVKIKMKRGKIDTFGVYWGPCNDNDCNTFFGNALIYGEDHSQSELVQTVINFPLQSEMIPAWDGGLNPMPLAAGIIAACNERLAMVGNRRRAYDIAEPVPMTLGVDTYVGVDFFNPPPDANAGQNHPRPDDIDQAKTVGVVLPIRCEPIELTPEAPDQIGGVLPELELMDAELTLRIDSAPPSHTVTYAGSCPVGLTLDVGVTTNIKGKVDGYVEHLDVAGSNWTSQPFTMTTQPTDGALWEQVWSDLMALPFQQAAAANGGGGVVNQQAGNGLQFNPGGGSGGGFNAPGAVAAGNNAAPTGQHIGFFRFTAYTGKQTLPIGPGGSDVVSYEQFQQTGWRKYDVTCAPQTAGIADNAPDHITIPLPKIHKRVAQQANIAAPKIVADEPLRVSPPQRKSVVRQPIERDEPVRVSPPQRKAKLKQILPPPQCLGGRFVQGRCACPRDAVAKRVTAFKNVCERRTITTRVTPRAPVRANPVVPTRVAPQSRATCPGGTVPRGGRCVATIKRGVVRVR